MYSPFTTVDGKTIHVNPPTKWVNNKIFYICGYRWFARVFRLLDHYNETCVKPMCADCPHNDNDCACYGGNYVEKST